MPDRGVMGRLQRHLPSSGGHLIRHPRRLTDRFDRWIRVYGLPQSAATTALRLQAEAGDLEAALVASEPDIFAGLWIEHEPTFRVVAAFTRDAEAVLTDHLAKFPDLAPLATGVTVEYSRAELTEVAATLMKEGAPSPFDLRIVEKDNRVEVMVESRQAFDDYLRHSNLSLLPQVSVRTVASLARPTANIYGGLDIGSCTSGFAVKQNGSTTTGVTTAGHCPSAMSYQNTSLPFVGENFYGPNDEQWHTTPGFTDRNWVWNNAYNVGITSKKTWSQQSVGMFVCHMGQATLYGCGKIVTKSFRPSYVPSATATFIQVSALLQDLSSQGDSGGPWWIDNTALGVMSGEVCFITCNDALYVAINYVEGGLGVTILTSS